MPVPTYDQFIEPVLRYLALHPDGVPARQAHDAAADTLELTDEDRQQLLPSGAQPIYKNRAGWAHDRLKRAGLSSSPRRGIWKITPKGSGLLRSIPVRSRRSWPSSWRRDTSTSSCGNRMAPRWSSRR